MHTRKRNVISRLTQVLQKEGGLRNIELRNPGLRKKNSVKRVLTFFRVLCDQTPTGGRRNIYTRGVDWHPQSLDNDNTHFMLCHRYSSDKWFGLELITSNGWDGDAHGWRPNKNMLSPVAV